jgi:protein TonB
VVLEPFQTRQIVAQPTLEGPPKNAAKEQPQRPPEPAPRERTQPETSPSAAARPAVAAIAQPVPIAIAAPPAEDNAPAVGAGKAQGMSADPGETSVTVQGTLSKGVTLPSSIADYLSNPPPTYPALSLRLGEQGKVMVRVQIGKNGRALQARVAESSGFDRLDQAALRAVLNWRYVPGTVDGQAQDMWFDAPINFKQRR